MPLLVETGNLVAVLQTWIALVVDSQAQKEQRQNKDEVGGQRESKDRFLAGQRHSSLGDSSGSIRSRMVDAMMLKGHGVEHIGVVTSLWPVMEEVCWR